MKLDKNRLTTIHGTNLALVVMSCTVIQLNVLSFSYINFCFPWQNNLCEHRGYDPLFTIGKGSCNIVTRGFTAIFWTSLVYNEIIFSQHKASQIEKSVLKSDFASVFFCSSSKQSLYAFTLCLHLFYKTHVFVKRILIGSRYRACI